MHNHRVMMMAGLLAASSAWGWLPEAQVDTEVECFGKPAVAYDSTGRLHCVYAADPTGSSQVFVYRTLYGTQWSAAVDLPGPNHKEAIPGLAIDANDGLHVIGMYRPDGNLLPYTIFYWRYDGTSWSGPEQLSPGTGDDGDSCGNPQIAVDRYGDAHVVWSQGGMTGGAGDIMYRKRQGGVWQATRNLTANPSGYSYGSAAPDLAVDRNGNNVHVVWHDDFAVSTRTYYAKNTNLGDPAAWGPSSSWAQLSSDEYGKSPMIYLDRLDRPHVFWTDTFDGGMSVKYLAYRYWNGSTWAATINLGSGPSSPDAAFDASNFMRYVYSHNGIQYRTYNYSTFSTPVQLNSGINTWKADAAAIRLGPGTDNPIVVWEERKGEWPGVGHIYWTRNVDYAGPAGTVSGTVTGSSGTPVANATVFSQTGDYVLTDASGHYTMLLPPGTWKLSATRPYYTQQTFNAITVTAGQAITLNFSIATTPPGPVSLFKATPASESVTLTWKNPSTANLTGVMVRCSTTGYPASPTDGVLLINQSGAPNANVTFTHTGLINGVTLWYTAFAHYDGTAFAAGVQAMAAPAVRTDFDRDGDVDQSDFGHFQSCLSGQYVAQAAAECADAKLDLDDDVDGDDLAVFTGCISGERVYAAPHCAD